MESKNSATVDNTAVVYGPGATWGLDATGLSSLARLSSRTYPLPGG